MILESILIEMDDASFPTLGYNHAEYDSIDRYACPEAIVRHQPHAFLYTDAEAGKEIL